MRRMGESSDVLPLKSVQHLKQIKKYEQSFSSQPNNALGIEIHSFCRLSPYIFDTVERKYDTS